ncbi:MAG TPA: cbb3-type cytochrome c oxidase subunit 3 [Burkholderiales bacterium]|nr:cbb3-type cytochrome c oxidase subunit 3 [Burkholderiales bacterium]
MADMQQMQDLFGTLSGIFTAVLMALLIGITLWAWSGKRRDTFDAAARAPLEEDSALRDPNRGERAP